MCCLTSNDPLIYLLRDSAVNYGGACTQNGILPWIESAQERSGNKRDHDREEHTFWKVGILQREEEKA